MDFEDVGDDLSIIVDNLSTNEKILKLADTINYPLPKLLGKKKALYKLRAEIICAYAATAIHIVNLYADERMAKLIIDSFLEKSSLYFFKDIEKNTNNFQQIYGKRLNEYFPIFLQEKAMIGLSFHLYRNIGFSDAGNIEKQLLLAKLFGNCLALCNAKMMEFRDQNTEATEEQVVANVMDELKREISDWKADAAKAGLEMIIAYSGADSEQFEALQSKLTFSQFQIIMSYVERMTCDDEDEEDFDYDKKYEDYHQALDDIVEGLKKPIKKALKKNSEFDETTVLLACEMITYAIACHARKETQIKIHQISWNSFKTSVEHRAMPYVSEEAIKKVESSRPKPRPNEFISYATPAFGYLQQMENLIKSQDENTDINAQLFLKYFSINVRELDGEIIRELDEKIEQACKLCEDYIVFNVQEVFS